MWRWEPSEQWKWPCMLSNVSKPYIHDMMKDPRLMFGLYKRVYLLSSLLSPSTLHLLPAAFVCSNWQHRQISIATNYAQQQKEAMSDTRSSIILDALLEEGIKFPALVPERQATVPISVWSRFALFWFSHGIYSSLPSSDYSQYHLNPFMSARLWNMSLMTSSRPETPNTRAKRDDGIELVWKFNLHGTSSSDCKQIDWLCFKSGDTDGHSVREFR